MNSDRTYTTVFKQRPELGAYAIVVIGIYLGFKREFSKLIGFLVIALIAVGWYSMRQHDPQA